MDPKEQKRAALYEKLQQLRSVTNSSALNKTSIIVDASKYIEELKEKVETLNREISGTSQNLSDQNQLPMEVTVESVEKGFLINVFSEKNCPGLLVSILEAFDELGLDVLDARVSCSDSFHLEAVGGEVAHMHINIHEVTLVYDTSRKIDEAARTLGNEGQVTDVQIVKQAVLEAIKTWKEANDEE